MDRKKILESAKRVLRVEAGAIEELIGRIDDHFVRAVELLAACQGRTVVTGMGKSGLIGKKIAATLASTGTPAFFLHAAEGIHGDIGMVSRGDIVVAISNSGETDEMVRILPALKRLGVPLICLTGNPKSTLARNSEVVLDVGVREEAEPLGLVPTASTTAALAMGDALAITLFEKRELKDEDFAAFHPGGALGRRLLHVSDVMHTGAEIPIVSEETPMKDVIMEMTSKKLGAAAVLGSDRRLAGVITDGDLRRLLEHPSDPLGRKAREAMTRNPKVIAPDALAAKAVQVMEQYSITVLIVVEPDERVTGIVHLHDLLKKGIV